MEVDEIVRESYDAIRHSILELSELCKRPLAEVILQLVRPWEDKMMLSHMLAIPANHRESKGVPRYRHPLNPNITWSGSGKRPNWFVAYRNGGGNVEDLKIKPGPLSVP